jgi:hypothetical protein
MCADAGSGTAAAAPHLESQEAVAAQASMLLERLCVVLKEAGSAGVSQIRPSLVGGQSAGSGSGRVWEEHRRYCSDAVDAGRLYGSLEWPWQAALSRAAVYRVAVTLEGLSAVTGMGPEEMASCAAAWQRHGLAHPSQAARPAVSAGTQPAAAAGQLWSVYGVLRAWLVSEPRLDAAS